MPSHNVDYSGEPQARPEIRVAVLDDWQRIAEHSTDWSALTARAEVVFFHQPLGSSNDVVKALADFDIILAMRERTAFSNDVISRLPRLKFFNMTGRRARGLDEMLRRGITVSITGGGEDGQDTAEHALALMLSAARRIPEGDASIKGGSFLENVPPGFRLAGKTLGILGLGLIGGHIANYCRALGMNVIAWSRSMTDDKAAAAGVEAVSIDDLFARADIVSLHLVLSPETEKIVGRAQLSRMRDGAVLVNTSRAPLIDEQPLLEALRNRRIQAAIDVFNEEPLPAEHPLRTAPNVVLTPHVGYGTREMYQIFYRNSVENILAFLDGAPIRQYSSANHLM
ncbi:D-2-hydroxyacid dehydrogenase family protein [Rhizobium lusitanum]|uniref:D-2-hydroxyacid dehydrogenase family protein n=1 Tax=Rhizobium lusitanum TaxID=293958 RepID=UPI001953F912|nr:D-2-hydroxyacid dehydrogenase family protein [Rhizobium lusitanum]